MRNKSAALFIRCPDEDAEKIRIAAKAERRTVVLNAVISRIDATERLVGANRNSQPDSPTNHLKRLTICLAGRQAVHEPTLSALRGEAYSGPREQG